MLRWFPWRQIVSWVAQNRGFVDPVKVLSRLESFAQPLEVKEPLELLRAGMLFHARGLLNSGAIQYNLDWIWPYWVERQYDPRDPSFIPRAFSITHINLSHRDWTAVGVPDCAALPIVDPRGLVTPLWDGWSLDFWVTTDDGARLFPSRLKAAHQHLDLADGVAVVTRACRGGLEVVSRASMVREEGGPTLLLEAMATAARDGWLVASLRPVNPEGVSFVERLRLVGGDRWEVEGRPRVWLAPPPERHQVSSYRQGDVAMRLDEADATAVSCPVGMATAAARYRLTAGEPRRVRLRVPLGEPPRSAMRRLVSRRRGGARDGSPRDGALRNGDRPCAGGGAAWPDILAATPRLDAPDPRIAFLWDAAVRSLVLHSPGDVYPGPYTYKRFWFRDAAFLLDGLLALGLFDRVERVLDTFPRRQTRAGHFLSQEGEWDSNGEALWILHRYCRLRGVAPKRAWERAIRRGGRWIGRTRLPSTTSSFGEAPSHAASPHAGLLPAGFSAEHLGPNDYYYWDDFWGVGGLRCAAAMLDELDGAEEAAAFRAEADDLEAAVIASLDRAAERLGRPAMPASPYRRLDAGAIGSLAAGYPLRLWAPRDERLLDTVEHLLDACFVNGAFFQDMIQSGLNPYLTLHVAQVLLRAGDPRAAALLADVARLASPTGQWPEAIHPRTGGGCMGDGQHAWAAAEWVVAVRNLFVREEGTGLVLGSGIPDAWLTDGAWRLGPTPTPWGPLTVSVESADGEVAVGWEAEWRDIAPSLWVQRPGGDPLAVGASPRGRWAAPRRGAA